MSFEKFTYAVREETVGGIVRYFAAFQDGAGILREVEIPREVYLALEDCRRDANRQIVSIKRHQERLALSESQLAARASALPTAMEECVEMRAALATLTETQWRRFMLYHAHGLSIEQIAQTENRAIHAIEQSINAATGKLKNFFEGGIEKQGSECAID